MKSFIAVLPLCAGIAFSQSATRTETKTTWDGTLVDAACQTTETQQTTQDPHKTETTRTVSVDCPVTAKTTTFGLMTADGKFIRFDEPSNTRVIEVVKSHKTVASDHPVRVHVVGMANGETAIVESVDFPTQAGSGHAGVPTDVVLDARYDGDKGKLVVGERGITFQNVSDARRSKTWTYGQIQEFKRTDNNKVMIEPFDDDEYEFQLDGPKMADTTYKLISDRIVAARNR